MQKLFLTVVCILTIAIGVAGSQFTTAQETPATPGVPLMCATPSASPEASATTIGEMGGTPVTGAGPVIASPGVMVGETCSAVP